MRSRGTALALLSLLAATSHLYATAQWRTERRVAGDTTIVRTVGAGASAGLRKVSAMFSFGLVSGPDEYVFGAISDLKRAPDGSLWVFDGQVPVFRKYDSTGKFIRNVGRSGSGPGEYTRSNGVAIHNNGNVMLWDGGTLRIRVYSAAGEHRDDWTIPDLPGNTQISAFDGLRVDTQNRTYVRATRFSENGRTIDSILRPMPLPGPQAVQLQARVGSSSRSNLVPFTPLSYEGWSREGYYVQARSHVYALHLLQSPRKILRIERDIEAVRSSAEQRQNALDEVVEFLRGVDPNWSYSGPPVSQTLPYFSGIIVDEDSRIWVRVAVPLRLITDADRAVAEAANSPIAVLGSASARAGGGTGGSGMVPFVPAARRFMSDIVYDVFAPDGRFLGRVPYPGIVSPRVMKGDFIWGVTFDSLGVQSVTKFRVEPSLGR